MYTDPSLSGTSAKYQEEKRPFLFKGKIKFRRYIKASCSACGKDIFSVKENNAKKRVCSLKCRSVIMTGPKNPLFKGRKFKDGKKAQGHVLVYSPKHPHNYRSFVPEHRLVVEKKLKRFLKKEEIVHHINCVKYDNNIKNLFVCSSIKQHNLIHGSINKIIKSLLEKKYIRFNSKKSIYEII